MWERQFFPIREGEEVSGRYAKRGCSGSLENGIGENWWSKRFWMLRRTQHYDVGSSWGAVDMGIHFWQGGKKKRGGGKNDYLEVRIMLAEKIDMYGHVGRLNPVSPCGHFCQRICGLWIAKVTSKP